MKKFIFVMPLMAVSLLASCGGSKIPEFPKGLDSYKKEIEYDKIGENIFAITKYEYNDKSLPIEKIRTLNNDPGYKNINKYTYDEHENLIDYYNVLYVGEEIEGQFWYHYDYTYDEQNRVTKQVEKRSNDNVTWEVSESCEYEYKENIEIEKHYHKDDSLHYTITYTYDKKGNLINEKEIYSTGDYNREKAYAVDKNGCATKIEEYNISSSGERIKLTEVSEITYLNNLWYRPLKETTAYYEGDKIDGYRTIAREYDSNNRITSYKRYDGTDETPPYYIDYYTYEY